MTQVYKYVIIYIAEIACLEVGIISLDFPI